MDMFVRLQRIDFVGWEFDSKKKPQESAASLVGHPKRWCIDAMDLVVLQSESRVRKEKKVWRTESP